MLLLIHSDKVMHICVDLDPINNNKIANNNMNDNPVCNMLLDLWPGCPLLSSQPAEQVEDGGRVPPLLRQPPHPGRPPGKLNRITSCFRRSR
jgi:hypothetical protein